jgi:hypothetical protein
VLALDPDPVETELAEVIDRVDVVQAADDADGLPRLQPAPDCHLAHGFFPSATC